MSIAGIQSLLGSTVLPLLRSESTGITDTSTEKPQDSSGSGAVTGGAELEGSSAGSSDFELLLKTFLPGKDGRSVSEEELFSAAVGERISSLKGEDALATYQLELEASINAARRSDGFVPYEQATIDALKNMVDEGALSEEEGDRIYTEAFEGAQLDGDTSTLFDDRGGSGDSTVAVETMEAALSKFGSYVETLNGDAPAVLKSLASAAATGAGGTAAMSLLPNSSGADLQPFETGSSQITPTGTTVDGPEGFLFKPVSDNEGTLAVLLSESWTGNISSVVLKDSAGNVIEEGRFTGGAGVAETGREKYSFSKSGDKYGSNVTVEVTLSDGSVKSFTIPDPSKRYD